MLLIGYARVSKSDGVQTVVPQRDALLAAGITPERIYEDIASGRNVSYQEYRCVYGEDAESALRFLFNAMSEKTELGIILQGIPEALQLDNGPVEKSAEFKRVMDFLGVTVIFHKPRRTDGRRTTARSQGKVERPFRTVKEAHETLYHFHKPATEAEANRWLANYIATYNAREHRHEPHGRLEDWQSRQPSSGLHLMCSWERFCSFAREPECRTVGIDCQLTVAGVTYELDASGLVKPWWSGGDFSTRSYLPSGMGSSLAPSCRSAALFSSIDIVNTAKVVGNTGLTR